VHRYETFTQSALIGLEAAKSTFRKLAEVGTINLDTLQAAANKFEDLMTDLDDYVAVFSEAFGIPEDKHYLLADTFKLLDVDHNTRLNTKDLLHGLVQLVPGSKCVGVSSSRVTLCLEVCV